MIPGRLWSLRDMLDHWGYRYLSIATELSYIEMSLDVHLGLVGDTPTAQRNSDLQSDDKATAWLLEKCQIIEGYLSDQELGPIPSNLTAVMAGIIAARNHQQPLYAIDLIREVQRLKNDLRLILSNRFFYSLRPECNELYGKPALFGERVAKKFPKAADDIEWAGNCLALGQPTACVLHLDRAMEIAMRKLVAKLKLTPNAKATMGKILADMEAPINRMPDLKELDKRKKEEWSECRINLRHVKSAWRDPTSHGKKSYDEKQARQVFDRVKEFMQQLATLL
jgi:hypothetical protein